MVSFASPKTWTHSQSARWGEQDLGPPLVSVGQQIEEQFSARFVEGANPSSSRIGSSTRSQYPHSGSAFSRAFFQTARYLVCTWGGTPKRSRSPAR